MEDYRSNSHKSKESNRETTSEKKVEKIIKGAAKSKKKNEFRKLADIFISEDVSSVKSYILMDVLVPAVKKAISEAVVDGIDMILYGETGRTRKSSTASKVPYTRYYDRNESRREHNSKTRAGYSYDDIILDNRGEAEEVLSKMDELVDIYGLVSIADLYDLVGITGNYTDNKYGWADIRNAQVVRVRDGYMLKLPKALPLN